VAADRTIPVRTAPAPRAAGPTAPLPRRLRRGSASHRAPAAGRRARGSASFPLAVTPYYVLGIALAAWAVIVAAFGIKFDRFPGGRGGERIVIGLTVLLVAGTVGSAIVLSAAEESGGSDHPSAEGGHE
jgi:hypothetical protein